MLGASIRNNAAIKVLMMAIPLCSKQAVRNRTTGSGRALALALSCVFSFWAAVAAAVPTISNVSAPAQVGQYQKLEVSFDIAGVIAQNFQLPYDPNPPFGIDLTNPLHQGISVDAEFSPDGWQTIYRQPAFYYRRYQDAVKVKIGRAHV